MNVKIIFVHNDLLELLVLKFNSNRVVEVYLDLFRLVSQFFLMVHMAHVKDVSVLIFLDDLGH